MAISAHSPFTCSRPRIRNRSSLLDSLIWPNTQSTPDPNDASITRLVGAVLLVQDEHCQLEGRRMLSAVSMTAIPSLAELPAQPSLQEEAA